MGVKEACEKYRVTAHTIYKWRRRTDFDDRSHAPKHPNLGLSPFERHVICEVRKSTGFSLDDLVDALRPHIPHIGKGNVYRLLAGEKLNRKTYLTADEKSSKPKLFKSYPPGYLHIDVKHLPKLGSECGLLFVAIDSLARLTTIHMYPKAGIREAVDFLDRCVRLFALPISYVLTDNGACFTDCKSMDDY